MDRAAAQRGLGGHGRRAVQGELFTLVSRMAISPENYTKLHSFQGIAILRRGVTSSVQVASASMGAALSKVN